MNFEHHRNKRFFAIPPLHPPFQYFFQIIRVFSLLLMKKCSENSCDYLDLFRFLPTPAPPSEDGGENNEEDGDNPDSDGDNEEAEPQEEVNSDGGEDVAPVEGDDEPGMWEETFKSHSDSKPYGRVFLILTYDNISNQLANFQVPVPLEWISRFLE